MARNPTPSARALAIALAVLTAFQFALLSTPTEPRGASHGAASKQASRLFSPCLGERRDGVRRLRRPRAAGACALVRARRGDRPVPCRTAPGRWLPPVGAIAFGRTQECDYVCERIADPATTGSPGRRSPKLEPFTERRAGRAASRRGRSSGRGCRRTSGSCAGRPPPTRRAAASPSRRQLLVPDAQRHHVARARAMPSRGRRRSRGRRARSRARLADAEDQVDPVAHRDVLALAVDVDVARRAVRRDGQVAADAVGAETEVAQRLERAELDRSRASGPA